MKKIKLKIKYSRLAIVAESLLQYADICTIAISTKEFYRVEDYKIRLSIAMEVYYTIHEKLSKRYPSENYNLSLELHHALVLQSAMLKFISKTDNPFEQNAIEIVKNNLNEKIVNQSTTVTH